MKLTPTAERVLSRFQLDADVPVVSVARELNLKAATVHYHLKRAREEGVIRRGGLINLSLLGFQEYSIYFSLQPQKRSLRTIIYEEHAQHPRVGWIAQLGGVYEFGVSFIARSVGEVGAFLRELNAVHGDVFSKKEVLQNLSFSLFQKFSPRVGQMGDQRSSLTRGVEHGRIDTDSIDQGILAALFHQDCSSHAQIARICKIPRTTVEYRLKQLQQKKVILGYILFINTRRCGLRTYRCHLFQRGLSNIRGRLDSFIGKNPCAVNLVENVGSWDFDITLEVPGEQDALLFRDCLCEEFADVLSDVQVVPVFDQTTSKNFLNELLPNLERASNG